MKFTVVSPSFNQGRFIGRCVESVQRQRGVEIEHLVLDNCSDDETHEVVSRLMSNSNTVGLSFVSERDRGQSDAINKGFVQACGDVVCWLNTDEYYDDGVLAEVARFFHRHPDADIVYGDCRFVDAAGDELRVKREGTFSFGMLLYYGCFIPSCSTFIRRRVIDAGYLLDERFRVAMDFEYYVRLAGAGFKFMHIPLTVANFTWHELNVSSVQEERRRAERLSVQVRYSPLIGPVPVRRAWFWFLRYFWVARRVCARMTRGLLGGRA